MIEFLQEIESQLKFYVRYAQHECKYDDKHPVVLQRLKALGLIEEILENKKRSIGLPPRAPNNKVYRYLTNLDSAELAA